MNHFATDSAWLETPFGVRCCCSRSRAWSLFSCHCAEAMTTVYVDGLCAGIFSCNAHTSDLSAALPQLPPN